MKIDLLRCDIDAELHIWSRHRVAVGEAEEAAFQHGLTIRGRSRNIYEVFGRTDSGRYLMLAVRYLGQREARLITARDMSDRERRRYRRLTAH